MGSIPATTNFSGTYVLRTIPADNDSFTMMDWNFFIFNH